MIKYNNYNITGLKYNGYDIIKVIGCGGNVVYEKPDTNVKMSYTISDSSGNTRSGVLPCDGQSAITSSITTSLLENGECFSGELYIGNCVTTIGQNAFYCTTCQWGSISCASILKMASSVTEIGANAFRENHALHTVQLPNSISYIGESAFNGSALHNITIPQNSGLNTIYRETFANNTLLETVFIPSNVKYINDRAFYNCGMLESVTVNRHYPPTLGTDVFGSTNNYFIIYVPASAVNDYKAASGWSQFGNRIQAIPT